MRNVLAVIEREYMQRVRTRAFVISTIAAPLIMMALVMIPVLLEARGDASERSIALVDHTGVFGEGLVERLREGGLTVELVAPASAAVARTRAEQEEIAGVLEVDQETLDQGVARWTGNSAPSTIRSLGIRQAVTQSALTLRLSGSGAEEVGALLDGGRLEITLLGERDAEDGNRAGMIAGFAGGFLLYLTLLIYGSMVMRAVLEEKTGRIVEIIISSMKPWELMLGKVVGVGAVGLTQLGIWLAAGALIASMGIPTLIAFLPNAEIPEGLSAAIPGLGVALFFLLSFLLGYFIYASLFAAVAAMCSTEHEAQQLQFPVVMLVVIPIIMLAPTLDNPNSTFAVAASLFPFFSPILMFARVAVGAAPVWQAGLALLLMTGTLFATAWVAGRIYKVGILMQGKRPTLPELWRWVRES